MKQAWTKMRRLLALAGVFGLIAIPTMAQTDATLDAVISKQMDDAGIMGVGAAIIVNGRVAWMKGYGFADHDRTRDFTPDTIMPIASVSKTFTGFAMMKAIEEGRLSLNDDINTYLPFRVINPHNPDAVITLWNLATHTSGITDRWEVYRSTYRYGGEQPMPLSDFLESYLTPDGALYSDENFLNSMPGARREYSNAGAALAGLVI